MPVALYMDHHVPAPITDGVRMRGVDALTAEEDGTRRLPDPDLLDRATELGRVLFSQDQDLLIEAAAQAPRLRVVIRTRLLPSPTRPGSTADRMPGLAPRPSVVIPPPPVVIRRSSPSIPAH